MVSSIGRPKATTTVVPKSSATITADWPYPSGVMGSTSTAALPPTVPADIRALLRISTDDLPDGDTANWDGWGRLNMGKTLNTHAYRSMVPGVVKD